MIGKLVTGFKNLLPFLSAGLSGTLKMTAAIKLQTIALWEQAKAFIATPIGWISVAAISLFAVNKIIEACTTSTEEWKEKLSKTKEELANLKSEAETLSGELETTQQRIAELEGKHNLTFTEAEELELLKQQNAELQRKIDLNDVLQKQARKENNETFVSTMNSDVNSDREYVKDLETGKIRKGDAAYTSGQNSSERLYINQEFEDFKKAQDELVKLEQDYLDGKISKEKFDSSKKRIDKEIKETSKYLTGKQGEFAQNAKDIEYIKNPTTEDEKAVNAWLDYINDFNDRLVITLGGDNAKENTISRLLDTSFANIGEKLKELGEKGDITAEMLNSPEYDAFINKLIELGVITDKTPKSLEFVALAFNKVEDAAEGAATATTAWTNLSKTISGMVDKYDVLKEAQKELAESGNLSADMLDKLAEKYPELNDDIGEYLFGLISQEEFMRRLQGQYDTDYQNYQKSLQAKLNTSTEYWNKLSSNHAKAINAIANTYEVDFKNCKTVEEAKAKIRQTYMTQWMQDYNKYVELSLSEAQQLRRDLLKRNKNGTYTQKIADLDAYIQSFKKIDADFNSIINTVNLDKFSPQNLTSTDFNTDSGKTEAEKYFDKLKYQLETNQITQEQYLKDLDWGYKHFYNKTADYLEDYAKYSQEVYDGFKDMYKEDLEAQKEAWEEKKDAVSEYYDNLREQIEDAHDEEDYEKEQSEKRKEIFDLDMQIAELMRDGSEKAKARIAELEEERLKAEEELLDFETDKAREDELSRLEKEQEAEEKKIQDKIDGIQKKLDKLDEDTISVRNAIIAYAKEKGITLDFAYASGTRSSVGGFGRINEKGVEMISAPDGNGNYIPMLPSSYVFSAKATEFLWKLATEHSLPQAMYNSIAKSIKTQSSTPSVNIAQPITITMGDVIIKGNADKQTVADIKRQQENTVRMVLQKIKELQK